MSLKAPTKSKQAKLNQVKPSQAKLSQTKPGQSRSSEAKPLLAKPKQARSSQATSPAKVNRHRIKDIADQLSLSTATVCRALNGSSAVKPATCLQVLEKARELGYVKDRTAMALRTGKHKRIVLMITHLNNPFFAAEANTARIVAEAQGYDVQFFFATDPNTVLDSLQRMLSQGIDGMFIFGSGTITVRKHIHLLTDQGIPVLGARGLLGSSPHQLVIDIAHGHKQAMDHLLALGHRHILLLGYMPAAPTGGGLSQRAKGIVASLNAHGLNPAECLEYLPVPSESMALTFDILTQRLARRTEPGQAFPTAIIASNDIRAQAAMAAVQHAGLRVPHDVSIVGCDDIEMGRFLTPALTTIRQSDEPICISGVGLLLELIQNPDLPPRHVAIQSQLVVRQSTGLAPGSTGPC